MTLAWVLLALAAAATTAYQPSIDQETALRPGKEYMYKYETQDLAGFSIESKTFSGLKIKCKVKLQTKDGRKVVAKMDEVRVMKVNEELMEYSPSQLVPDSLWSAAPEREAQAITEQLAKPFKFSLRPGKVVELQVQQEDALWSVNVKRGFLSSIQLDLLPSNDEVLQHEEIMGLHDWYTSDYQKNTYIIMEEDILGECETAYTVLPAERLTESVPEFKVTKVKNLDNCRKRPFYKLGITQDMEGDLKPMKDIVTAEMEAEYRVQGNRNNFLVKWGKVVGKQFMLKGSAVKGVKMTWTVQQVQLIEVRDSSVLPRLSSVITKENLIMEIPKKMMSSRQYEQQINEQDVQLKASVIEQLLDEAVQKLEPQLHETVPEVVANISLILKQLPGEKIRQIVETHCTVANVRNPTSPAAKKAEILMDILPDVGKDEIIPIIMKLKDDGVISTSKATLMLSVLTMIGEPTLTMGHSLIEIYRQRCTSSTPEERELAHTCLLGVGVCIHKLDQRRRQDPQRQPETVSALNHLTDQLITMLDRTSDYQEKNIIIKAMGNAGMSQCTDPLQNVIYAQRLPIYIKEQAVFALRRVAPKFKAQIQNIVIPLYLNQTKAPQLRMAAFWVAMETKPSFAVMKLMVQNLYKERSVQVGSFVYSYMKSQCECWYFCDKNVTITARQVMKYAKPFRPTIFSSKVLFSELYKKSWNMGMAMGLWSVNKPHSYLPDSVFVAPFFDMFGLYITPEFGVEMQGLQTLMKNIQGPYSILNEVLQGRKTVRDILHPYEREFPAMLDQIRDVMNQIPTMQRTLRRFSAGISQSFGGNEYRYTQMDAQRLQELIEYLMTHIPRWLSPLSQSSPIDVIKTASVTEQALIIPTASGLPNCYNFTLVSVMGLKGSVQVQNALSFIQSQFSTSQSDVVINLNAIASLSAQYKASVGIKLHTLGAAIVKKKQAYIKLPFQIQAKINPINGQFKIKYEPTSQNNIIIKLKDLKLATEQSISPSQSNPRCVVQEKPIHLREVVSTTGQKRYSLSPLGVDLEVQYKWSVDIHQPSLGLEFCGHREVFIRSEPCAAQPRDVEIKALYLSAERGQQESERLIDQLLRDQDDQSYLSTTTTPPPPYQDQQEISYYSNQDEEYRPPRSRSWVRQSGDVILPFEPLRSNISQPLVRQVVFVVRMRGNDVTKKMQFKLAQLNSFDLQKLQHNLQAFYQPDASGSASPKKMEVDVKTEMEEIKKWIFAPQRISRGSFHRLAKVEVKYSQQGPMVKVIDWETKLGKYIQQQQQQQQQLYYNEYNDYSEYSVLSSIVPTWTMKMQIQTERMPRFMFTVGNYARWLILELPKIDPKITEKVIKTTNTPNMVTVINKFYSTMFMMDMIIMTPKETDTLTNIPIPFQPKYAKYIPIQESYDYIPQLMENKVNRTSWSDYLTGGSIPGSCELMADQIHTFDKKVLKLPKTECELQLAKDCSSVSNPSFLLSAKKIDKDEDDKEVKIYLPHHKIKILQQRSWSFSTSIKVKVNDRDISVPNGGQPIIIRETSSPSSPKAIKIKKIQNKVEIYFYKSGVEVITDCKDIFIKVHPSLHSQLCGLCSNYNSEPMDDLIGPNMQRFNDSKSFIASYVVPSGRNCDADRVRNQIIDEERRLYDITGCSSRQKTMRIEKKIDGERKTCFSVRPVTKCVGSCRKPEDSRKVKVGFHCLPSGDRYTQTLVQKEKLGQEVTEVHDKAVNFKYDVEIPDYCRPVA